MGCSASTRGLLNALRPAGEERGERREGVSTCLDPMQHVCLFSCVVAAERQVGGSLGVLVWMLTAGVGKLLAVL